MPYEEIQSTIPRWPARTRTNNSLNNNKNNNSITAFIYIGFEALHGEVSMYIWFAVTPCVYLLAR